MEEVKKKTNEIDQKEDEAFRIRSKIECLYVFLDQLRQEEIQHILDIDFWQKRIIKESNPNQLKNLEMELNKYKEEKKDIDTRLRITKSMIEEEKRKLNPDELAEILQFVKPRTQEDMVRNSIDFFVMSTVPFEVNLKFWQSRLLEQTQPEVKTSIETQILPNIKRSIELNQGGQANARAYLETLKEEKKDEDNKNIN